MYNKIDINNIPSTKRKSVGYRSNISSEETNEFNDNVLNDILDLFNKANNISKELDENKSIIDTETNHLKFKIKKLESKLDTITSKYNSVITNTNVLSKYIYPIEMISINQNSNAFIDTSYNTITMSAISSEPKTYIHDEIYDKSFTPPSLYVETEYLNINKDIDILKTEENEINNCLCGDNNKYWIREITTNSNIQEIEAKITITLPEDILTTRDINEILVKPYPTNSIDIINIEYSNYNDFKIQVPTFSEFATSQSEYNILYNPETEEYELLDVDSIKLNFKEIAATKLIVTFRQKYFTKNSDGTNNFVFGFKDIDIRNNKYPNSYNSFQFNIDFNTNKTVTLSNVEPIITNNTQVEKKSIVFDYYYIDHNGEMNKIFDKLPFICPTNKIFVKGRMFSNNCTPNITKFKIDYLLN